MLLAGGFFLIAQHSQVPATPGSCPERWAELPGKPAAWPAFVLGARGSPRRPCATIAWGVLGRRSIVSFGSADPDELLEKALGKAEAMGMKPRKPGRGKTPSESTRMTAHEWVVLIRQNSPGLWGPVEFKTRGKRTQASVTRWGCNLHVVFMQANDTSGMNYILETKDVIKFCLIAGLFYKKV